MANAIQSRLQGNVLGDLARFENKVKSEILLTGVAAMARVIYSEVKANVNSGRPGRVTGNLQASIYRAYAKDRSSDARKIYQISWNKKTAPHGHLIEFGTSRAPAYPFLRPALGSLGSAINAGKTAMKSRLTKTP